jgi:hypothetical protein
VRRIGRGEKKTTGIYTPKMAHFSRRGVSGDHAACEVSRPRTLFAWAEMRRLV